MKRAEEWDWPPRQRRRYPRAYYAFQRPTGWNSPFVKKAVHIYWRVTITAIKMVIAVPLTIMGIGAIWLLWILFTI